MISGEECRKKIEITFKLVEYQTGLEAFAKYVELIAAKWSMQGSCPYGRALVQSVWG